MPVAHPGSDRVRARQIAGQVPMHPNAAGSNEASRTQSIVIAEVRLQRWQGSGIDSASLGLARATARPRFRTQPCRKRTPPGERSVHSGIPRRGLTSCRQFAPAHNSRQEGKRSGHVRRRARVQRNRRPHYWTLTPTARSPWSESKRRSAGFRRKAQIHRRRSCDSIPDPKPLCANGGLAVQIQRR